MLIHELTPAECYDVIGRATYGRLGCARYDQPYVVPFVFQLDQPASCLFSISTVGQKIHWMRENPKVCVEVDEVVDQLHWTSVLALGRYEEIRDAQHDEEFRKQAEGLFRHRAAKGRSNWTPNLRSVSRRHDAGTARDGLFAPRKPT